MKSKNIYKIIELLTSNGISLFVKDNELKVMKRTDNKLSEEILSIIKSNKEELITFLNSQKNSSLNKVKTVSDYGLPTTITNKKLKDFLEMPVHESKVSNVYPLTPLQKGFLFHNLYDDDKSAYICQFHCDLKGAISRESFNKSWMYLLQQHTVLRTAVFGQDLDIPVQTVYNQVQLPINELDYSSLSKEEFQSAFDKFLKADEEAGFNLEEAPLFRMTLIKFGEDDTRFVFTHHHIILDGWSVQNIMRNFHSIYIQLEKKGTLPELALDDFGSHLRHISSVNEAKGLSYWQTYLSDITIPSYIPFVKDNTLRNKLFGNKKIEFTINGSIKAFTKKHRITENTLLQGAWAYLLSKYTGNETVTFGAIISGRDSKEEDIEAKIGLYMNTIPVCSTVNKDAKIADWLQELQKGHTTAREEYGDLALNDIESQSNIKGSLFDTLISFQNYLDEEDAPSIDAELRMQNLKGDTNTNYAVTLDVYASLNQLKIILQYNNELISDESILNIKGHFETLFESLLDDIEYIKELNYLTKKEEELLIEFNNTEADYDKEKTVLDLIAEQVLLNPEATALVFEEEHLTYKELDLRSKLWAANLIDSGVKSGSVVALRMTRSTDMITAILSVMKAGASYMVIDQGLPNSRTIHMMEESLCTNIITNIEDQPAELESYTWISIAQLDLHNKKADEVELPKVTTNDLAYLLYTSGSTGKPKGCMISHGNLFNFISWGNNYYFENNEQGNWGLISSMSFDLSVTVIFTSLTRGKKLYIGSEKKSMDQLLEECLNNPEIDTLMLTPTHVTIIKDLDIQKTNIEIFICGGEELKKSHIEIIKNLNESCKIYNEYGPTETTVGCTAIEVSLEDEKISIGRPIANTKIYILDANAKAVPVGVVGEIYISGRGVSKGYIGNPSLTAEKFVSINNSICYKTGDLAKWDSQGRIDYAGRIDDQVKIRGHRIQLKEIESVLDSLEEIQESTVIIREDHTKSKQLVAYIVSSQEISNASVQKFLETKLPEYMVPRVYVRLDAFPTTTAGKINRNALPIPEFNDNYAAPVEELEKQLVVIWQKLLGVEKIGIHDNFYELGGDSIKAIQLASRSKSIGIHFQVKDVFNYQTIAEIVLHLKSADTAIKETGLLEGEVPLHPIQKLFFKRGYEAVNHSNQSVLLKVSKTITNETLVFALSELVKHHDVLRMNYYQNEGSIYPLQKYESYIPKLHIEQVDSLKDIPETGTKYQADLDIFKGDLARFVLFETSEEEKENRLFIAIHHLAVDGVSWRILTEDLINLIENHSSGSKLSLPEKATSYRQWVEQLNSYASTANLESEYIYWKEALSNYSPLPVDTSYDKQITYNETENIRISLEPALTHLLVHEMHTMYGTEINDILISALTIALSEWIDAPKVVIALEGHGREELFEDVDINRTTGWFTSVYPVCLDLREVDDIGILIADTKDMLRGVPNKGIGYNVLQFESKSEKIKSDLSIFYEDLTFNYLGSFTNVLDAKKESKVDLASESTGLNVAKQNANPHKISIDSIIIDGSLQVDWNYDAKRYKKETVQKLANAYITALEDILSHSNQFINQEEDEVEEDDYQISIL
ncbi:MULTISPECIES: non-ribosomal peptide synthetase [Flavobacterium]|uniref:non-ribosomal peptide synthetase n=1 Tax=Flavobacterium TaxID=237 RepID=UPI002113B157|nr:MULTISPECIES: non-ribosomal peptide synthetase [Flavobacterium]UUF16685.1 amino acid adenylation domain-containing protein [Flavobacterium panici]